MGKRKTSTKTNTINKLAHKPVKVLCENRKARHDYIIISTLEAGIELTGDEVISARAGHVALTGSYVAVLSNELWLMGCNFSLCHSAAWTSSDAINRKRRLLCHKKEIRDIRKQTEAKGLTAVPLELYDKNGRLKIKIALVRGKNMSDKRDTQRKREISLELSRVSRYN